MMKPQLYLGLLTMCLPAASSISASSPVEESQAQPHMVGQEAAERMALAETATLTPRDPPEVRGAPTTSRGLTRTGQIR
jgi:hypothetical protein